MQTQFREDGCSQRKLDWNNYFTGAVGRAALFPLIIPPGRRHKVEFIIFLKSADEQNSNVNVQNPIGLRPRDKDLQGAAPLRCQVYYCAVSASNDESDVAVFSNR